MKKNLFLRTEVLPEEIPALFSNKGVYMNFTKQKMVRYMDSDALKFITVPMFFHIPKSKGELRKIGLLHPIAQVQAFEYMLRYEQLIPSFCKNSSYSVRSPVKLNHPKIKEVELRKKEIAKIEQEFSLKDKSSVTSDEDQILFFNYFSYRKYKKITDLYHSPKFNRDKYKYSFFLKLDIQRCFPSIYTHSLAWAIFGEKSLAKKYKDVRESFPTSTDKIAQKINFNETHGLVVGPEFSRVLAEILLTRVDIDIENFTRKNKWENNREYSLYRFIDDYFLFANDRETIVIIQSCLKKELEKYNLILNMGKTKLQEKPFEIYDSSIISLKQIIKEFELDKMLSSLQKDINYCEYKGNRSQWNELFFKMEKLIATYPESKSRIVNYFLKTIRQSVSFDGRYKYTFVNIMEIISNIYTLDINWKSTNYFIAIFAKLLGQINQVYELNNLVCEKLGLSSQLNDSEKKQLTVAKEYVKSSRYLKEKMFQYLFMVLKNNVDGAMNMYDILVFLKLLDKKLSSSFLCKILSLNNDSYFVCCSVAYYILNEDLNGIDEGYITVIKKLESSIKEKIEKYTDKGASHRILESDYFYFLNDFSKYPGFRPSIKNKFSKRLVTEYNKTFPAKSDKESNQEWENRKKTYSELWEAITRYPYFDWNTGTDTFVRKVVKKSSNMGKIDSSSDY